MSLIPKRILERRISLQDRDCLHALNKWLKQAQTQGQGVRGVGGLWSFPAQYSLQAVMTNVDKSF